jgi:ubiquitin-protein ligase
MTPRERRLISDLRQMEELAASGRITFRSEGQPPTVFHVMLSGPGLALVAEDHLTVRHLHRCDLYLHRDYPRRPPIVTWLTPVFHPNILGPERNGGVCIGSWSAAESLSDLCLRLIDLVAYRALNEKDALNVEAAGWVRLHRVVPGADLELIARYPLSSPVSVGLVGALSHET